MLMFILSILGCNRTTKSDKHPENDHPQSEHRKTGLVIIISVLLSPTCEICHIWMHRYGCSGQATAEEDLDFSAYGLGTSGGFLKGTDALVHSRVPGVVVCCNWFPAMDGDAAGPQQCLQIVFVEADWAVCFLCQKPAQRRSSLVVANCPFRPHDQWRWNFQLSPQQHLCLAAIQQGGQDNSPVDCQFYVHRDATFIPYQFPPSSL